MERSAEISDCGRYRWTLMRRWGEGTLLGWIMLNPSTADGLQDDSTIRRCIGFARDLGHAGILVANLYAWRATNPDDIPREMQRATDVVGPENDAAVDRVLAESAMTIAGWGAHWWTGARAYQVKLRARWVAHAKAESGTGLYCLARTKHGDPGHPLYLPRTARPQIY